MTSDPGYARGKLHEAVRILTIGEGTINERLFRAAPCFVMTTASDMPDAKMRREHERILEALKSNDGKIDPMLIKSSDASEIAGRILDLCFDLDESLKR